MKNYVLTLLLIFSGIFAANAQSLSLFYTKSPNIEIQQNNKQVEKENKTPKFTMNQKTLTIKNVEKGSQIDIYSVLGVKVTTFTYNGNDVDLALNRGIYIVKVGKHSQKIML